MADPQDKDDIETSLRETHEEIGLEPSHVTIVSKLLPRLTIYNVCIMPLVGIIPEHFVPKPNPEVEDVFTLPLRRFLSARDHTSNEYIIKEKPRILHTFTDKLENNKEYTTWGLTARLAMEVAVGVLQERTEYECDITLDEPSRQQRLGLEEFENRTMS